MLVLILAPAAVMAAGQQGQAQGIGNEAGNCLNVQHQIAGHYRPRKNSRMARARGAEAQCRTAIPRCSRPVPATRTCEQDQDMVRNMTRDQIRLDSESGLAGKNQGAGPNGDGQMLQNRSCDQDCEQDQAMVRNMTHDQIRLHSDSVQQQNGTTESVQNRFGLTKGNGQNILASFTDQLGSQFRHMGGIFQTLGQ